MGHIGYTPQFKKKFKIEGQTESQIKKSFIKHAELIQNAGAFAIGNLNVLSQKQQN